LFSTASLPWGHSTKAGGWHALLKCITAEVSKIMGEHGEPCADGADESCPICRGEELDPDFVARIEQAAAQPGRTMTFDEAMEWLRST
jgi:hypothetical protein